MEAIYLYLPLILLVFPVYTMYYLSKINNLPPSPFSLPFLGHLYLIKDPIHQTLSAISARYGPVLLLKLGERRVVIVSSPEGVKECFTTKNDIVLANRPHLMAGKYFGENFTNLAWCGYDDGHTQLRSMACLDIFSRFHHDTHMMAIRKDEVRLWIKQMFMSVTNTTGEMKVVKMKKKLVDLVLNAMMMMFAGKKYFGEGIEETKEAKVFNRIVTETFKVTGETCKGDYFPSLAWLGIGRSTEKKMKKLQDEREAFVQNLIDEIRGKMDTGGSKMESPEQQKKTVIQVLLEKQQDDPEKYKDKTIMSSVLVMLAAGTDTSAGTMEWALSLLLNNPHVLNKAQKEIDTIMEGQERLLEESDLEKLNYLDCIIKETLRMYPAGPMLVPHESSTDCTVGGYQIPGNTMLMVNMWAIQNDPNVWEEPTKFMPERFESKEKDEFKWLPFGYGRRSCPGEGLARRMVGLALGSLIQCFEWERVDEKMIDMSEGPGITLIKATALEAKCRPRKFLANLISNET